MSTNAPSSERHHVVVIGSGFGGLFATQALKNADVDITLVAKTTQHLFQDSDSPPPLEELLRRDTVDGFQLEPLLRCIIVQ